MQSLSPRVAFTMNQTYPVFGNIQLYHLFFLTYLFSTVVDTMGDSKMYKHRCRSDPGYSGGKIKYPSGSEILRIKVVPRDILCYGILGSSSIFESSGPADITVAETKLMKRHLLSFRPLQLWEFTPHPTLARVCYFVHH